MTEDDLELAERRADRMRVLDDMAGGMAHEFLQPIAIIRSSAENLLIGHHRGWNIPPERTMDQLAAIVAQCDRMAELIGHLRSLTQRPGDLAPRPAQVSRVVDDALRLVSAQCLARGIRIRIDDQAVGAMALVDALALEECLIAVLHNARDAILAAGRPGEVVVGIARGDGIRLSIRDDGHGMDPALVQRIGQAFFTTKRPGDGVGLGLAIARQLLAAMDCRLELTSVAGAGTTVVITCPEAPP